MALILLLLAPVQAVEIRFAEESSEGEVVVPKNAKAPPAGAGQEIPKSSEVFQVDYTPRFTSSSVQGQSGRAFYADGGYTRQDLVLNLNQQTSDGHYLRASVGTLYTDDPVLRAGGPTVSFPSAFVEVGKTNSYDLRMGQVPVYFSRYSFLRQVDGLKAQVHFPDELGRWSLEGVLSRTQTPRGLERYRQSAHGARISRRFDFQDSALESVELGFNNSWSSDESGSLNPAESQFLGVRNGHVASLDMAVNFDNGLQLDGEYGLSDMDLSGTQSVAGQGNFEGRAGRLGARYFQGPWSGGVEYERISPGFRSLVGAAAPDLERLNGYVGWSVAPQARFDGSWRSSINNLGGQLTNSFEMRGSRLALRLTPWAESDLAALRSLGLEIAHNGSQMELGTFSSRKSDEMAYTLSYYYGPAALTVSHRDRQTRDSLNSLFDRDEQIQAASLAYRIGMGEGFALTPSVGMNFSRAKNLQNLTTATNDNVTYGISGELGQYWRFDYAQNVVETLNPGTVFLTRDSLNIFRRASLNYMPWGRKRRDLVVGLQWADRELSDTLPGSYLGSSEFTAIIRSRF